MGCPSAGTVSSPCSVTGWGQEDAPGGPVLRPLQVCALNRPWLLPWPWSPAELGRLPFPRWRAPECSPQGMRALLCVPQTLVRLGMTAPPQP